MKIKINQQVVTETTIELPDYFRPKYAIDNDAQCALCPDGEHYLTCYPNFLSIDSVEDIDWIPQPSTKEEYDRVNSLFMARLRAANEEEE